MGLVREGSPSFGISLLFLFFLSRSKHDRDTGPPLTRRPACHLLAAGTFPVAAFVAGLLVRHLGPTAVFPLSGERR
jgi:hypothetical protein